ncbi:MAG TPA: hypothetical protein VK619_18770 [Pyrinomonadaceae bacterium]|nr:hypothetical protein [Pyrinomonadaceae bacterium]
MKKKLFAPLVAIILLLSLATAGLADTIHLKDGSVIHGQIIGFNNQQFIVLIGSGARGRRSRITIYMEDVESIEFDAATGAAAASLGGEESNPVINNPAPNPQPVRPASPPSSRVTPPPDENANSTPSNSAPQNSGTTPTFFQINTRVRGDNASNGWTNTGLVVRRGQRIRISASGRVSLGANRISTPTGIPNLSDANKLMRNEATGGLIAVIGDDNDDFIFIGSRREFVAQRDGVLFLGVNESNLNDNTGAYDAVVEAEAIR